MERFPGDGTVMISLINKKLYRAFSRQANGLTLNIPVLQGLLIGRLKQMRKVDKLNIMNYKFESMKQRKSKEQ